MAHLKIILCSVLLGIGAMSCENDDYPINCEETGGKEMSMIGKIYSGGPYHTFYIGSLDDDIYGGRIPCNELPERFKKEGIVVKVKGISKGAYPGGDPVFGLILITHIEEHNE